MRVPVSHSARGVVLASLLGLLAACDDARHGALPPPRPSSIVLITVDSLRSDHLPSGGHPSIRTPAIDRLVADGILFERAFSHAPLTLPSHVSLLSGLLPSRHGVRDDRGYRVSGDLPWLPETLRDRGWATGAAVSTSILGANTLMSRGFDSYDDEVSEISATELSRSGSTTVDRALAWLGDLADPLWLLFVQIDEPRRPRAGIDSTGSGSERAYETAIVAADEALGALLDGLDERGLYDQSLILLTSDHGTGLGEHGEHGNGFFVYRESLQVPLIMKLPGGSQAGRRVERPVQLVDVAPTLLERVGIAPPTGVTSSPTAIGASLLRQADEERLVYAETYQPRLYYGAGQLHTLIGPRFQYIESREPELYDLVADPTGELNIVDRDPELAALFRERIAQLTADLPPPSPVEPALVARLAAPAIAEEEPPTARSRISSIASLEAARRALQAGHLDEARQGLGQVIERNPLAAYAWAQLSRLEAEVGREEEALEAMLTAIGLSDNAPFRLLPTAKLALRLGHLEEAEALATEALEWHPAEANGILSRAALRQGNLELAADLALTALDLEVGRTAPALSVLEVQLRAGRPAAALRYAGEIESRITTPPGGLNLLIGEALVQLGRDAEAVEWVEKEVSLFPERARPYGYLATLYGKLGRAEEAGDALDRLLASVPDSSRYYTGVRALIQLGFPREAVGLLRLGLEEYPDDRQLQDLARAISGS